MTPNALYWSDTTRKLYAKPPYLPEDVDGFNVVLRDYVQAVRDIARSEGVGWVDVFEAYKKADRQPGRKPGWLCRDGMHPDEEGHRLVTDLLIEHLSAADKRFARKSAAYASRAPSWTPSETPNSKRQTSKEETTLGAPGR